MAAHRGNLGIVQALGKLKYVEVNAVDNDGRTALHHAAANGHHNVVSELWALGCALELTDCVGWTGKILCRACICIPSALSLPFFVCQCLSAESFDE